MNVKTKKDNNKQEKMHHVYFDRRGLLVIIPREY